MYVFGECSNKCIENIPAYSTFKIDELDFINIDIGTTSFYCISIIIFNYDSIYNVNVIKEFDLLSTITKMNFDDLLEIHDGLIMFNIDYEKTRNMITYDFFGNIHYDRKFLVSYSNCKLTDVNELTVIDTSKPINITTFAPIVISDSKYFQAQSTFKNSGFCRFWHRYIISNMIIQVTIDQKEVYLELKTFSSSKEYELYKSKILDLLPSYSSKYTLITKFTPKDSFEITIEKDDNEIFSFKENICPITMSSIVNQFQIGSDLYEEETFTSKTDITGHMYYPKKNRFYDYKILFDLNQLLYINEDTKFTNNFLSFGFITSNDFVNHTKVKETFKFVPYRLKNTYYINQIYGNLFYNFTNRFENYLEITATSLLLENITLYNKDSHDHDISTYSMVSDDKLQTTYLSYKNNGNYESLMMSIKASELNPYRCLGYHLKLTTKGRELFKDMYSDVIKYSLSYLNIQFMINPDSITSTYKFSADETGSTTIPGLRIPLTDLKNLEMWNNQKNRFINIRGILSDIRTLINSKLTDGTYTVIDDTVQSIYISNISLDILINGRLYSLISEQTTNPIKVDLEKDLPIMVTIEY